MAKQIALLSYEFLFDPSETWSHISQFESDLAKFFKAYGMEAQVLDSINPKDGRRVLFIRKNKEIGVMGKDQPPTQPSPTSPQDVIKKYSNEGLK